MDPRKSQSRRSEDVGTPATLTLVAELALRRPKQQDQSAVLRRLHPTASRPSHHKQPRAWGRGNDDDNDTDDKNIAPLPTPCFGLLDTWDCHSGPGG